MLLNEPEDAEDDFSGMGGPILPSGLCANCWVRGDGDLDDLCASSKGANELAVPVLEVVRGLRCSADTEGANELRGAGGERSCA